MPARLATPLLLLGVVVGCAARGPELRLPAVEVEDKAAPADTATPAERAVSEITVTRHVPPVYPATAQAEGLGGSCAVRLFIDERGVPYQVQTERCPEAFVQPSLEAASSWRFEPVTVDGRPVRAQFVLVLKYTPTEAPDGRAGRAGD